MGGRRSFTPDSEGDIKYMQELFGEEGFAQLNEEISTPSNETLGEEGTQLHTELTPPDPEDEGISFMQKVRLANGKHALTNNLVKSTFDDVFYQPDESYDSTLHADALMADIPEEYRTEIVHEPQSLIEAVAKREKLMQSLEIDRQVFSDGILSGLAASIVGASADPTMILAMATEARVLATVAKTASTAKRAAAAAATGGAIGVAEVAAASTQHDDIGGTDMLIAGGFGAGVGGGLGLLFKGVDGVTDDVIRHADDTDARSTKQMWNTVEEQTDPVRIRRIQDDVDEVEFEQVVPERPDAEKIQAEQAEATAAVDLENERLTAEYDQAKTTYDTDLATYKEQKAAQKAEMAAYKERNKGKRGKAREPKPEMPELVKPVKPKKPSKVAAPKKQEFASREEQIRETAQQADADGKLVSAEAFESGIGKWLTKTPYMSQALRMGREKSAVARSIMTNLLENASGVGGRMVNKTASQMKNMAERVMLETFQPTYSHSFRKFRKAAGVSRLSRRNFGELQEEFNLLLRKELEDQRTAAGRNQKYESSAPDYIQKAAAAANDANRLGLERLQKAGVLGADEVQFMPGYVKQVWQHNLIGKLSKADLAEYRKLLARGYESMNIDAKTAKAIANAVLARSRAKHLGFDTNPVSLFARENRGYLEDILRESGKLDADDIASILKRVTPDPADAGKSGAMKGRASVNLNMSTVLEDGRTISLLDLVDNDLGTLMSRSYADMAGRSALASHGIRSRADVEELRSALHADLDATGSQNTQKVLDTYDALMDEFHGRPIDGGHHKAIRRLMDWTTLARLGQVGIAQFAEANNLLASHGLLGVMRNVPAVMKLHRQLKWAAKHQDYSKLDKPFMRELMVLGGGMWDEHQLFRTSVRLNDSVRAGNSGAWEGKFLSTFDNALASGMDSLGYVSGLYKMKAYQQQMTTMLQAQKILDIAKGGGNAKALARLADIGLSSKEIARIKSQLKHVEFTGKKGDIIHKLNLDKWDVNTREDFLSGLHRHTNQIVQLGQIGEKNYWQTGTLGAMFQQFRTFGILAVEKQFARNVRMADTESIGVAAYGMALSTVATYGRTYLNATMRPDREEYLEKQTRPAAVVANMTRYAGFFSPMSIGLNMADTFNVLPDNMSTRGARGGSPTVAGAVPVISLVDQAARAVTAPLGWPYEDDPNYAAAARNGIGSFAFGNTVFGTLLSNTGRTALGEGE